MRLGERRIRKDGKRGFLYFRFGRNLEYTANNPQVAKACWRLATIDDKLVDDRSVASCRFWLCSQESKLANFWGRLNIHTIIFCLTNFF